MNVLKIEIITSIRSLAKELMRRGEAPVLQNIVEVKPFVKLTVLMQIINSTLVPAQ